MTPAEAVEFFTSQKALAGICKVTPTAVNHWVRKGWIPYDKQCLIQVEAERAPRNGKRRRVPVASWHDIPAEERSQAA